MPDAESDGSLDIRFTVHKPFGVPRFTKLMDPDKPLGRDQAKMRKRVFYIVAGILVLGLLIACGFLFARRGKQPYKVSLIYYKLNPNHPAIQKVVQDCLGQLGPLGAMVKPQVLEIIGNIYHAEIELTDRHGKATRLSFGPKGLGEYAKPANESDYVCGDMWLNPQKLPFDEFAFEKTAFLNEMEGSWKPGDYKLLTNNCVDFAREFIKQVSAKGNKGLDMVEKVLKAHDVEIYAGIKSAQNLLSLARMFAPDAVEMFRSQMADRIIAAAWIKDVEPLHIYHAKDASPSKNLVFDSHDAAPSAGMSE